MINIDKIKTTATPIMKVVVVLLFVFIAVAFCVYQFQQLRTQLDKMENNVHVMTTKQAVDTNVLQNELGMNKNNAKYTSSAISDAIMSKTKPDWTYNETYENVGELIPKVEQKVLKNDSTLPPYALKKTDATIIVSQPETKEATVGIYKVNNYKNWELGVGVGVHEGDLYVPVSLQRNLNRWHSVALEVHTKPIEKKVNGVEARYTINF